MDGPSVEHSDSDSGESWTLLENNSVYADEAPEFIEEQAKHELQHHEKDEDTDGISIISDSDHETPSPPPPDHIVYETCNSENLETEKDIPDYIPVTPKSLPNINNSNQDPGESKDFLGDTHSKHKTYVHRRNKRLSTVLNIIVLGSVITAAGVAIGHMWGAKNDCTLQTTSSVNKILSNLYKLQEENAYLRSKLKELTLLNNNHNKQNKCRRVFEESLSTNEPKKVTKCVDENYNSPENIMEHLVKPKFEKEFVADIDKLKTVYLQNKSWLDDEISRRLKIEEELLKKYNNEVKSAKEVKKNLFDQENAAGLTYSETKDSKEVLNMFDNFQNPTVDSLQKKVTYADSLQNKNYHRFKSDENKHVRNEDNNWLTSKHNINNIDYNKQDFTSDIQSNQNLKLKSDHENMPLPTDYVDDFLESSQTDNSNRIERDVFGENWTEVKPKFRRNEERYESDYENSVLEPKKNINSKVQQKANNNKAEDTPKFHNEDSYKTVNNKWSQHAQENKNKVKNYKRNNKQNSSAWKNDSNEDKIEVNFISEEDIVKDDRYVVNKLKQEKKKNGRINSNKKQKRKSKHEKWNTKGEFEERFEAAEKPKDFVLNYPDKNHNDFNHVSFINNIDDIGSISGSYKDNKDTFEHLSDKDFNKKIDTEKGANWFEKRAVFRKEARKKYYEQFGDTSPNNSSWYFRRMRKREQCRAKGDNSTFRKIYKEKTNHKIKH